MRLTRDAVEQNRQVEVLENAVSTGKFNDDLISLMPKPLELTPTVLRFFTKCGHETSEGSTDAIVLGKGVYCSVMVGLCGSQLVAIKQLNSNQKHRILILRNEGRILSTLREVSPKSPAVYGMVAPDVSLAMEVFLVPTEFSNSPPVKVYLEGHPFMLPSTKSFTLFYALKSALVCSRVNLLRCLSLCIDMAEILRDAHRRAICHLDLHSKNVHLRWATDESSTIKVPHGVQAVITDWGLAREAGESTFKSGHPGSAPEYRKLHGAVVSTRGDVWQLGQLFRHMKNTWGATTLQPVVSHMTQADPANRPTIESVCASLYTLISPFVNSYTAYGR